MSIKFETEEDDFGLSDLMTEIPYVEEQNAYIAQEEKAVELVAKLVRSDGGSEQIVRDIRGRIERIFQLLAEADIPYILDEYKKFQELSARLTERKKIDDLHNKVVIGLGGKFSAGKSKFINAISKVGNLLPVAQNPTTSIPTYILKDENSKIIGNSIYGYTTELTSEQLNAMTHEFYNAYKIGFSAFVDSIIVKSSEFSLPEEIALLDTPGYTKYDGNTDSKTFISDRKRALQQLKTADRIIWLSDASGGEIGLDDIEFLRELEIARPILVVFTKADKKPEKILQECIEKAEETLDREQIPCYGVTAYSAIEKKEYVKELIPGFFQSAIQQTKRSDLLSEFERLEQDVTNILNEKEKEEKETAEKLLESIRCSKDITDSRTVPMLWSQANRKRRKLLNVLQEYDQECQDINRHIRKLIRKEQKNGR